MSSARDWDAEIAALKAKRDHADRWAMITMRTSLGFMTLALVSSVLGAVLRATS
jgi:hypothetical protein